MARPLDGTSQIISKQDNSWHFVSAIYRSERLIDVYVDGKKIGKK